jgi:hypothetical protein
MTASHGEAPLSARGRRAAVPSTNDSPHLAQGTTEETTAIQNTSTTKFFTVAVEPILAMTSGNQAATPANG